MLRSVTDKEWGGYVRFTAVNDAVSLPRAQGGPGP
ncbi:hypothetical protein CLV43_103521 [Umezawaea tangerina]|uniref:Uncharacterized protein n=1 Tax=Umezawaea tangerina TaxID=84725 RepID=A0A2T0TDM7_9PSEU|nr:hypothetical protein CLV43_103521 [Umezawaea tangerina]